MRWRVGQCLPYGDGVSYWALSQVVKTQASILESDSGAVARAKLDVSVDRVLPRSAGPEAAGQVKERLAALLGLPGGGADPTDDVAASHAAWRRYLLALAEDTPTVLVIEDLHAADDGLLTWVLLWLAAATVVLLRHWRRGAGVGLLLAYVLSFGALHWLAATVYLLVALSVAFVLQTRRQVGRGPALRAGCLLVAVEAAQGSVGFVQYYLGLPALLVGAHLLGACLVWLGTLYVYAHSGGRPAWGAAAM